MPGKDKCRKSKIKSKSSSESDTPRYSMRAIPKLRRRAVSSRCLRQMAVVNYEEIYDYRTGKSTVHSKKERNKDISHVPFMPSEIRMVFQDIITENHRSSPPGPMPQPVLRLRGLPSIQPLHKPSKAEYADTVEPDEPVPSTLQEQLQDEDSDDTGENEPPVKQRKI